MKKRIGVCYLGAVLIMSTASLMVNAAPVAAMQSTTTKSTAASKKSKKKPSKPTQHGQTAPTPDRIREIQSALKREGALNEEPNGKFDDDTVAAMKKYQGDHGLTPTGKIDALTLEKLGLGSDTAGRGAPVPSASSAPPAVNPAGIPPATSPAKAAQ